MLVDSSRLRCKKASTIKLHVPVYVPRVQVRQQQPREAVYVRRKEGSLFEQPVARHRSAGRGTILTLTLLRPGRRGCGRLHTMLRSDRCATVHGTPPMATAGSQPSPAVAPSVVLSPVPAMVACRDDMEAEVMLGVSAAVAVYAQLAAARHCARTEATETASVGREAGTEKPPGSSGWYTLLVSASFLTYSTCCKHFLFGTLAWHCHPDCLGRWCCAVPLWASDGHETYSVVCSISAVHHDSQAGICCRGVDRQRPCGRRPVVDELGAILVPDVVE